MKRRAGVALLVLLASAHAAAREHARAALVVASPPGPLPEELAATRTQLLARYRMLGDPGLRHVLEGFVSVPTAESRVQEALDRARQKMRQLDLAAVTQALVEAERAASSLPPTPAGRAIAARVFLREAAVALTNRDTSGAHRSMALALSADPTLTLEPVDASPPMVQLLASERARRSGARTGRLNVRSADGPVQVSVEGTSRGVTPLALDDVRQGHVVVWCVRDGYRPAVKQLELGVDAQLEVSLEPLDAVTRAAPLVEALRRAESVSRVDAARALAAAIDVDVVVLLGSDPRAPLGLVEIQRAPEAVAGGASPAPKKPWFRRGWVWGVIVGSVAVVATGTALGVVYGRRVEGGGVSFDCCRALTQ